MNSKYNEIMEEDRSPRGAVLLSHRCQITKVPAGQSLSRAYARQRPAPYCCLRQHFPLPGGIGPLHKGATKCQQRQGPFRITGEPPIVPTTIGLSGYYTTYTVS